MLQPMIGLMNTFIEAREYSHRNGELARQEKKRDYSVLLRDVRAGIYI